MSDSKNIAYLFSSKFRAEQWIKIESAFIKFMFMREKKGNTNIDNLMNICSVDPFEVLSFLNEKDNEYAAFKKLFLSKTRLLNHTKFLFGVDHSGLINTGNSLLIKKWHENLIPRIKELQEKLKDLAFKHKKLVQIGRTHGVHTEPTSFGYKFAVTYSDLDRCIQSIFEARRYVEVVTFDYDALYDPSMALDLQVYLAKELGLFFDTGNSTPLSRGRYFNFLSNLNVLAQVINKHILDLSLLSDKEVGEIDVSKDVRKAMTDIELGARVIDDAVDAYMNLSFSLNFKSNEFTRQGEKYMYSIMMETCSLINRCIYVLENIQVNTKAVESNLAKADASMYSQKVLLHLLEKTKFSRDIIAHDLRSMTHPNRDLIDFRIALTTSKYRKHLTNNVLDTLFDADSYLVNLDAIYKKIFFGANKINALKKVIWSEWEIYHAMDRLASDLNREYLNSSVPVTLIAFSERSLVFAGQLMTRLNFPIIFLSFPHQREDLKIKDINCDENAIKGRRILIVEFLVHKESNLDQFIDKLREKWTFSDVKICSLLKCNDVTDEHFVVNWSAIECPPDDFYAGFGKNCGSSESYRHLPMIGIAI